MGKDHRGQPSGTNKSEGSGVPGGKFLEDLDKDQEITEKYTDSNDQIAEHVPVTHPNRNTDKDNGSNAGGYKGGVSS